MDWPASKESVINEATHFKHLWRELKIMPSRDFQARGFRQSDERIRIISRHCKWLFQINVASGLQALSPHCKMTLWRSCNVNDVRRHRLQHLIQLVERSGDSKPISKLFGH